MFRDLLAIVLQRLHSENAAAIDYFLAHLLAVCREVIEQEASELLKGDHQQEWTSLLYEKALDEYRQSQPDSLGPHGENALKGSKINRLLLLGEIACCIDEIKPKNHEYEYRRISDLGDDFEAAIAPRAISRLLKDRQSFKARVRIFVERQDESDRETRQRARVIVEPYFADDLNGLLNRFEKKIPAARLRTYTDELLRQVAQYFAAWDPLLEFLEDPTRFADREAEFERNRDTLIRDLRRNQPYSVGGMCVEDAVQETVLKVLQTLKDDNHGYIYEVNFVAWLTRASLNHLRTNWRRAKKEEPLDEGEFDS